MKNSPEVKIGDLVAVHEASNKKLKRIKQNVFSFGTVVAISRRHDIITVKFPHGTRDMRSYRVVPHGLFTEKHHEQLLGVKP